MTEIIYGKPREEWEDLFSHHLDIIEALPKHIHDNARARIRMCHTIWPNHTCHVHHSCWSCPENHFESYSQPKPDMGEE